MANAAIGREASARQADAVRSAPRISVALIDLRDTSGLDVIRALRAEQPALHFVVHRCTSVRLAVEAMRLGALAVFETPLDPDDLTPTVVKAIWPAGEPGAHDVTPPPAVLAAGDLASGESLLTWLDTLMSEVRQGSAADRWAILVLKGIDSEWDPKTIDEWARQAHVSRAVACEACRLVHVRPHMARDFARLLRAICRSGRRWLPETMLDFGDVRTLNRLLKRAGLAGRSGEQTPAIEEFLDRQLLIPQENAGLIALRALLARGRRLASALPPPRGAFTER